MLRATNVTISRRNQVCITRVSNSMHLLIISLEEDWDARNLLYSLLYNIGNALYIPNSDQKEK